MQGTGTRGMCHMVLRLKDLVQAGKTFFTYLLSIYSTSDSFSVHVLPLTLLSDPENPVREGRNGMNTPYLTFIAVLFPLPSRYRHHHINCVLLSGCLMQLASEQHHQTPQRQAMFLYSLLLITIFLDLSTYLKTASVYVGTCTHVSNTSTRVNNDRDHGCWKPHCNGSISVESEAHDFHPTPDRSVISYYSKSLSSHTCLMSLFLSPFIPLYLP